MNDPTPFRSQAGQLEPAYLVLSGTRRWLPIFLLLPYFLTLLALFLVWPINWPIFHASSWIRLVAYILACYGLIVAGYAVSGSRVHKIATPLPRLEQVIIIGSILSFILMFPISRIYTSRWPWEILAVIGEQGDAYRTLQEQLELTTGGRGVIAALRGVFAPLTFAVVPLGLIYWPRLSWIQRGFVVLSMVTTIMISLLRGTDREFADLAIISVAALMVVLCRSRPEAANAVLSFARRYWLVIFAGLIFVAVAASLYSDRKSERLGNVENRLVVCVNVSRICADIDAEPIAWLPLQARFSTSIFILSSASGFYGLELAMEKDFKTTYGLGHSPASLAVYELLTGDDSLYRRTYTYRNGFDGWSDLNYWSTLMVWVANDVGFAGTLLFMFALGALLGTVWRSATLGNSDAAAVLFCALMITMFYLTANNQLLGSYDGYFVTIAWTIIWLKEKRSQLYIKA